jgi:hypothetical protein
VYLLLALALTAWNVDLSDTAIPDCLTCSIAPCDELTLPGNEQIKVDMQAGALVFQLPSDSRGLIEPGVTPSLQYTFRLLAGLIDPGRYASAHIILSRTCATRAVSTLYGVDGLPARNYNQGRVHYADWIALLSKWAGRFALTAIGVRSDLRLGNRTDEEVLASFFPRRQIAVTPLWPLFRLLP